MSWITDIFHYKKPIYEVVQDVIKTIAKAVRQGKPVTIISSGRSTFGDRNSTAVNFKDVDDAYKGDAYIRRAIDKYVHLLFKEGWTLTGKKDAPLQYVKSRLAIMAAVTNTPTEIFMNNVAHDLVEFHNVFLVKARVKDGFSYGGIRAQSANPRGPVGAYFRVVPDEISPQYNKKGDIEFYRQSVGVSYKDFKPEDIIHIHMNKLSNEFFATPMISTVLDDSKLLRQIEDNVGMMIYRHLFPLLHWQVGNGTPGSGATQNEIETLRTEILNMPIDGAMVTSDRVKIDAVKLSVVNASDYLKYFENRCFTGLGVSQVAMGRGDSASRATAETLAADMHDQIKGYQQVLAAFVNFAIICELLQEGGYQPALNADHQVEMAFHEIDVDSLIKRQNHEVFKFTANAQTFDELRKALGMEPNADEKRLYFNMVTIPTAMANAIAYSGEANAGNASNRSVPKNQHSQSLSGTATNEVTGIQVQLETRSLGTQLVEDYKKLQHDVLELVDSSFDDSKKRHEIEGLTQLTFELLTNKIVREAMRVYRQGGQQAVNDIKQVPIGTLALPTALSTRVYLYMHNLQADVQRLIKDALMDPRSKTQLVSVFDSTAYRIRSTSADAIPRAYNMGYAMTARSLGIKKLTAISDGDQCESCIERDIDLGDLDLMSVPPWHHYCGCYLRYKEGDVKS
jgi:hypothetical protein